MHRNPRPSSGDEGHQHTPPPTVTAEPEADPHQQLAGECRVVAGEEPHLSRGRRPGAAVRWMRLPDAQRVVTTCDGPAKSAKSQQVGGCWYKVIINY